MGQGGTRERIKQAVACGKLFPHYLAPVLSACIVHRDDVPSLLETLNSHVLDPRINAFVEALADARAEGVIKEHIHGSKSMRLSLGYCWPNTGVYRR